GGPASDPGPQPVATLGPLVRVGVGAHRDALALPALRRELAPEYLGSVDLDDDLRFEVATGIHVEEGVGRTSEAVGTGMTASPIRIDRPVERQVVAGDV